MGYEFIDNKGSFRLADPHRVSYLYFPLAGEQGLLSAITPTLGGDAKTGQNSFLLAPVSAENLHNDRSGRNFWLYSQRFGCWSAAGASAVQRAEQNDKVTLEAGFLWHKVIRESAARGVRSEALTFIPPEGGAVELTCFTVTNTGSEPLPFTATMAYPIYGRSADNYRDHRHVTSLLHRAAVAENGVFTRPTLTFGERGHKLNNLAYGAFCAREDGGKPVAFEAAVEDFIGEGGDLESPAGAARRLSLQPGDTVDGFEVIAAAQFAEETVAPGASVRFVAALAVGEDLDFVQDYLAPGRFDEELAKCRAYWDKKLNLSFATGDAHRDAWMRWVSAQPILRRMFGCSFLPHHDYGRGGRGWRDLWQDCLALLFMEPEGVRELLLSNFGGVRFDGTNATIIGNEPGEFVADRNNITRVWTDHGAWPLVTVALYIHQTADLAFLLEKQSYFKDPQAHRGTRTDPKWTPAYGQKLKTAAGEEYQGTLLEHLLVQNLTAYYNVGEHGILRLLGADWNDGLDMAAQRGESVAFHCLYAKNLADLAELTEKLGGGIVLARELSILLEGAKAQSPQEKAAVLADFCAACEHEITGETVTVPAEELARTLRAMSEGFGEIVRRQEIVEARGQRWFNSYYDNSGRQVEGDTPNGLRMMLTGQVFALMSGVADREMAQSVARAADAFLYDEALGGYKLNTDFHEVKTDLGRLFGFAYGTKENGAVFCHMAVMYAYALYAQGMTREAEKALDALYQLGADFDRSRIYPGIPEYYNGRGRGMYHYLTGSASWLMMTVLTRQFGVRGLYGDLLLAPQLLANAFDGHGNAAVSTLFAGREITVAYENPQRMDAGGYRIGAVELDGEAVPFDEAEGGALLRREQITRLPADKPHTITVRFIQKG